MSKGDANMNGKAVDRQLTATSLLAQHEVLRVIAIEMVQAARTLTSRGVAETTALARRLAVELDAHNRLEEAVLEPLFGHSDAWSSVRLAEMLGHHRQEHDAFVAELLGIAAERTPSVELEARVYEIAASIYRHMDHEEIEYLNAEIVHDPPSA
jgi:hypothetical protein